MLRQIVRSALMLFSIPFVLVAVAFGWRPNSKEESPPTAEPTGLTPAESAHVAVMKFSAWLQQPDSPVPEQVERLASQLLQVNLADLARGPLGAVLANADGCEPELAPVRRRALGLALVAWSQSLPSDEANHARELGQACLAVGLADTDPRIGRRLPLGEPTQTWTA